MLLPFHITIVWFQAPCVAGQIWVTYAARAWQLKTGHIRWQFKTNCKTGINFTVYGTRCPYARSRGTRVALNPSNFQISKFPNFKIPPGGWETLESVSSCTRFSGILKISNFGFNRSSSKLVGMFVGIVPMFVLKDFVQDCFVAQICAKMCVRAVIRAYLRDEAIRNKILDYDHWNYPKQHAYQF